MNYRVFIAFLLASCFVASGAFDEKELKMLKKESSIDNVRDDTIKNKDREKIETVEVTCVRNEDYQENFRIYIYVEIQDRAKNTYLVEFAANQREVDSDFLGEEYWLLEMPHGELENPKVSAYAIQYGIVDEDGTFVLLSEEYDDVDSVDELKERTTTPFPGKCHLNFCYLYDDSSEGATESIYQDVRKLKL